MTEAQRQVLLAAAGVHSRYGAMMGLGPGHRASLLDLRSFGQRWMAEDLVCWDGVLPELVLRGWLTEADGTLSLTDAGRERVAEIALTTPLHWYEYRTFFSAAHHSAAHRSLCETVYGVDLCQHGLADREELSLLVRSLELVAQDHVLDLGCGSGLITRWLADHSPARFVGVDLCEPAVTLARQVAGEGERVRFQVADMNALTLEDNSFDVVLAVDTLYYAADLARALDEMARVTRPGGRLAILWTQWVEEHRRDELSPQRSPIGQWLTRNATDWTSLDPTASGHRHWDLKRHTLEVLRPEFEAEGRLDLWEYRHSEAARYAAWPKDLRSRALYLTTV